MMSLEMNWTLMFRLRSFGTKPYYAGVVVCVAVLICPHTDSGPPTESKPIHKLYISARGHYCGKEVPYFGFMLKFQTTQVGK